MNYLKKKSYRRQSVSLRRAEMYVEHNHRDAYTE